jgi:hypothetical protein
LYKLHVKHYHMSLQQFKARTSELALPQEVYDLYDKVIKRCSTCQQNHPAPARYRTSGLRAKNFGDMLFVDHCEVHFRGMVYAVLTVLDGATNLAWAKPQTTLRNEESVEGLRDWMDEHQCVPKMIVADMAFSGGPFLRFYQHHNIQPMFLGPRTPWPNRAETAVHLFKRLFLILANEVASNPDLNNVTGKQIIKKCCWARNNQVLTAGQTPLELAYGRLPPPLLDLEQANPEQLTCDPLAEDQLNTTLKRLAMKAHLEAKQSDDLRHDLALRIRSSEGPFRPGERVFFWHKDSSTINGAGEWCR